MIKNKFNILLIILLPFTGFLLSQCKEDTKGAKEKENAEQKATESTADASEISVKPAPDFNQDSAFAFVKAQLAFGPRVPGSDAHRKCADYLIAKLKSYGATVTLNGDKIKTFDGKQFQCKNIIASFYPKASKRIMMSSHWDTRPFADQDSQGKDKPIDGANDGASGVAVLLEVARVIASKDPGVGVDIFLWDLEDYGQPENSSFPQMEDSYCLGSQYWSKHPHQPGYRAAYGVLLDMVGAPGAEFLMEEVSVKFAGPQMAHYWGLANKLGFNKQFISVQGSAIIDDHYYINTLTQIPTFDIIHRDRQTPSGFGVYWHTHRDNIENVSPAGLKAVGATLLSGLWNPF
jgi:hypothetical protein